MQKLKEELQKELNRGGAIPVTLLRPLPSCSGGPLYWSLRWK